MIAARFAIQSHILQQDENLASVAFTEIGWWKLKSSATRSDESRPAGRPDLDHTAPWRKNQGPYINMELSPKDHLRERQRRPKSETKW